MKQGFILVATNHYETKTVIRQVMAKDFELMFSKTNEAFKLVEENPDLDGIIFDVKGETIDAIGEFGRIILKYPRLKSLLFTSREFYESIENEEARIGFWCMENHSIEELRQKVFALDAHPYSALERISMINAAFEFSPFGVMIMPNDNLNIALYNRRMEEIYGYTKEEYAKLGFNSNTHPADKHREEVIEEETRKKNLDHYSLSKRIMKKDGTVIWVEQFVEIVRSEKHGDFSRIIIVRDITRQKETEDNLAETMRSQTSFLENLPGMAYRSENDAFWTMRFVSDGAYNLTGYTADELLGNHIVSYVDLIVSSYRKYVHDEINQANIDRRTFNLDYEITMKNGSKKWVHETAKPIFDENGNLLFLEGIIIDISHLKKMERQLEHFKLFNQKLNLPNREFLIDKIQYKLDNKNFRGTIILVNLKESQRIYRAHGYQYLELLTASLVSKLKSIESNRVKLHFVEEGIFAFYAGKKMTNDEIKKFFIEIKSVIGNTILREQIRCGVGVTFLTRNITNAQIYLQRARIASEFINDENELVSLHIYDETMDKLVKREEYLRQELIDVCYDPAQEHKLRLVFQPIIDLQTGEVAAFEALARFKSDKYGNISPLEFIPVVENNRLIIAFGKKVINLAVAFARQLYLSGPKACCVSINISVLQLLDPNFAEDLITRIESAGVPPEMIMIEMTESIFSTNYEQLSEALAEVREYGIDTAIDDFGTGFSSLARIETLNFNTVKMDRVFVTPITEENATKGIAQDIINICNKFNIKSLAEGIETKEQYNALKSLGCKFGQGYYMSKPLEFDDALKYLEEAQKNKKN